MSEAYKKSAGRDLFESLVITVILTIFGTTFVVQAFKIPTGSMENTLLVGDHLLVNKFVFAEPQGFWKRFLPYRPVRRGDVIVFKFPGPASEAQEPGEHFVKRVIGVPGDRIKIVDRRVFVNGKPISEPYVRETYPGQVRPGDDFPPPDSEELPGTTSRWAAELPEYVHGGQLVVPPGHYFVLGDNREESWDSRFWGFVPRRLISGQPLFIYWSYETPHGQYLQTSFADRLHQTLSLLVHFFTRTRWRRTFRWIH